jgi:hypoxanthine phosphoribosyltransferase
VKNSPSGRHILFSREAIASVVAKLATEISRDYRGKDPLFIGILKGSFIFMADLVRRLDFPLELEFIRLSSYGSGRQSSGTVRAEQGLRASARGRHVLVVEDIIDTGATVVFLLDYLKKKRPASLRLCTLLDKPSRRRVPVTIDYCGLSVPDKFVVGYGLDYDENFRNLPEIYYLEDSF